MMPAKYHIKHQTPEGMLVKPLWVDETDQPLDSLIPAELTEQLISLLDNRPKAVERSSGGLILVKPVELFIEPRGSLGFEVKVKVLFRDLETDTTGKVISKKCVTRSKTVPFSEIKSGFSFARETCTNFVADFGMGLIPIRVIAFTEDTSLRKWATFVRHDEVEAALLNTHSFQSSITLYEIPSELLRQVTPLNDEGKKDFSWARNHAKKLIERGICLVPEFLKVGEVLLPPQLSLKDMDALLVSSLSSEPSSAEIFHNKELSISKPNSLSLLPFNENSVVNE